MSDEDRQKVEQLALDEVANMKVGLARAAGGRLADSWCRTHEASQALPDVHEHDSSDGSIGTLRAVMAG